MRDKTVCFAGHGEIDKEDRERLAFMLEKTVERLAGLGITRWRVDDVRGFQALAAEAILKQRESNPSIRLILVSPCRDQDALWQTDEKKAYTELAAKADKIMYASECDDVCCMEDKSRYVVEQSDVCVTYLKRRNSCTARRVKLAMGCGLTIINLA